MRLPCCHCKKKKEDYDLEVCPQCEGVYCTGCLSEKDHNCDPTESGDFMKADCIIEGLQILKKYTQDPDTHAEHDVFYGCPDYKKIRTAMSKEDADRMALLGWLEQDDSWAIFT